MNKNLMVRLFLITTGLGLGLIGLGYGLNLNFYPDLYGYALTTVNEANIFRAMCNLYLALMVYWCWAAFRPQWHQGALQSVAVVMVGLASGRFISWLVDGTAHPLLMFYMALEVFVLLQALFLLGWRTK